MKEQLLLQHFDKGKVSSFGKEDLTPRFPQTRLEFFQHLLQTNWHEHFINGMVGLADIALAVNERQKLLSDPIYNGEGVPKGNGKTVDLIVPGFGVGERWYDPTLTCLKNIGYKPIVYPLRYGINIEPIEKMIEPFIDFIKEQKLKNNDKLSLTGHSKGGLLIYAAWYFHPQEVEANADHLFFIGSPIPEEVNSAMGGLYLASQLALDGDDFRLMKPIENLQELPRPKDIKITSINSKNDPILSGKSIGLDGNHFEVSGSHAGLMWNVDVLKIKVKQMAKKKLRAVA